MSENSCGGIYTVKNKRKMSTDKRLCKYCKFAKRIDSLIDMCTEKHTPGGKEVLTWYRYTCPYFEEGYNDV